MDLEAQLRQTLARKNPSPDFAARVVRAAEKRRTPWRAIAASVMLTALLGGWTAHAIAERRAGERARDEVLLAMHIAGEKVRHAQEHVQQIGLNR